MSRGSVLKCATFDPAQSSFDVNIQYTIVRQSSKIRQFFQLFNNPFLRLEEGGLLRRAVHPSPAAASSGLKEGSLLKWRAYHPPSMLFSDFRERIVLAFAND